MLHFYDVMGTYLLGVDCRDISEYYPRQGSGYRCSFPVDIQLSVSSTFPAMYEFSPVFAYGLYGVICVLAALFVWKMVPETKGKTLEDMTRLWKKGAKEA